MSFSDNNNEVGLTRTQSSELDPQTSQSNSTGGKYVPPHVRNRVVKESTPRQGKFCLQFVIISQIFNYFFQIILIN
jgi:hypothetical protein